MEKNSYPFLFLLLLLMINYCNPAVDAVMSSNISMDESALVALRSTLMNLDPSNILSVKWSVNSSICNWVGVTCGLRHKRVIGLNISNMGLEGNLELVPQLGNLSFLVSLDLSFNNFRGSLPQELTRLRRLRVLILRFNNFGSGGSIPLWFGTSFPQLQILDLRNNTFAGVIPSPLFNISKLEVLDLTYNALHGEIPMEFGDLQSLKRLYLQENKLVGFIPLALFNISKLEVLSLAYNRLSGSLPDNICKALPRIRTLFLDDNELSGKIQTNISACSELWNMDLSFNKFDGLIPREIGNIPTLEILYLQVNNLTGEVPASLFNISTLKVVRLSYNHLTGNLPPNLGHGMPNLEILDLAWNDFWSASPELNFITSLGNCRKFNKLLIYNNQLNGTLPSSIGNLSSLEDLYAYGNGLKGNIPHEIGNLSRLVTLSIFANQLTGSLPESVGNLRRLQTLNLAQNKIQGTITKTLCKLVNLYTMVLSENQIGYLMPDCIGNLSSLRHLLLGNNKLNGTIPASMWNLKDLQKLNLSSNSFSGLLAPEIGKLKVAYEIDLSMNQFSHFIPETIGNLIVLENLSLNHNKFQGSIPNSVSQIVSLEYLDLSNNNLTGQIPPSFQKLRYLMYFNVSFNDLSSEIPSDGPFINFSSQSFLYNKGLCGDSKYKVPPCPITQREKSKRKPIRNVVGISVAISMLVPILCLTYALAKHNTKKVVSLRSWSIPTPMRFSYNELLEATESYAESRLLGSGSFGSVYRATLSNGKEVVVKVFNLDSEGAHDSFEVECKIFRQLRHRNLCKVIGSCSNQEFKALVLEHMPTGSLEKWLYSHNYFLDLLQRINIMIDVASALEYLHYGYSTPIIHCDLKPSNVLLDENMIGHVSDFGISKLLEAGESTVRTMTLATKGYIAPEFRTDGLVSTRCDVYSYGILLIKVFTRTKPTDEMFAENVSLRSWINDSIQNGSIHIVDSNLLKPNEEWLSEKSGCVSSILELALCCSMESPSERINIKDVRVSLEKIKHRILSYN